MLAILHLLGTFVVNLFRSRRRLEVENLFLRHQLNIALRRAPVVPKNRIRTDSRDEAESAHPPGRCLRSSICLGCLSSTGSGHGAGLKVENLFLRHQLNIALRRAPHRLRLHGSDGAVMVWMTRVWPSLLGLSRVVSLTRSCGGIEQGFGPIGAGNLALNRCPSRKSYPRVAMMQSEQNWCGNNRS